jgi:hypothetical protein
LNQIKVSVTPKTTSSEGQLTLYIYELEAQSEQPGGALGLEVTPNDDFRDIRQYYYDELRLTAVAAVRQNTRSYIFDGTRYEARPQRRPVCKLGYTTPENRRELWIFQSDMEKEYGSIVVEDVRKHREDRGQTEKEILSHRRRRPRPIELRLPRDDRDDDRQWSLLLVTNYITSI